MTFILGFTDRVSLDQKNAHSSKDGFNTTKERYRKDFIYETMHQQATPLNSSKYHDSRITPSLYGARR